MMYTLDTSVVIDAVRQPDSMVPLKHFLEWALPFTALISVVVAEILRGARTDAARTPLETQLVQPFQRRRRIIAPSVSAWARTGTLLGQHGGKSLAPTAQNDLLIACTARELGWVVLTRDRDFLRLQARVPGLKFKAPFPDRWGTWAGGRDRVTVLDYRRHTRSRRTRTAVSTECPVIIKWYRPVGVGR